jgi:hypothetical protein
LSKSAKHIEIEWSEVTFSSNTPVARVLDRISYQVEIAMAPLNINTKPEYQTMISQPKLLHAAIRELSPATSYLIRLSISYGGQVKSSDPIVVKTESAPPAAPSKPRLYNNTAGEYNFSQSKSSLLLRWSDNELNGSDITRYQVQLRQIYSDGSIAPGDCHMPRKSSPLKEKKRNPPFMVSRLRSSHHHFSEEDRLEESEDFFQTSSSAISSEWKVIYGNTANKCYLEAPASGIAEWHIRVRAKSVHGWSDYSEIFTANARSHPSLFQALSEGRSQDDEAMMNSIQMMLLRTSTSREQSDLDSLDSASIDSGSSQAVKLPVIIQSQSSIRSIH